MLSVLRPGVAVRVLVVFVLTAVSLVAPTLAAAAASNVILSGVVVDANGVPSPGVPVSAGSSVSVSGVNGTFSLPVTDGSTVSLFVQVSPSPLLGNMQINSEWFVVNGTTDLGQVTLPPLRSGSIRVVDDNGSAVYDTWVRGFYRGLDASNWLDAGHELTSGLSVMSASYEFAAYTDSAGLVPIQFPRMITGDLPLPMEARYRDAAGGTWIADLADATGTDPFTVNLGGFVVAPPSAPSSVSVSAGDSAVWVSWPFSRVNGAPVTGYTVVANPGGRTVTVPANETYAWVDGLTNGLPYTFAVTATSTAGDSAAATSAQAIPTGPPTPPTGVTATAGDGQAILTWNPVPSPEPITNYRVTLFPTLQEFVVPSAQHSTTLTGLVNGTTYNAYVRSVSINGSSEAAESPLFTPSAPTVPTPPPTTPTPTPTPTPIPVATIAFGSKATVAGTLAVGSKVKVKNYQATVTGGTATYQFQWYADNKKIKKATKPSLLITKAMKGKKLKVKVTAIVAAVSRSLIVKAARVRG